MNEAIIEVDSAAAALQALGAKLSLRCTVCNSENLRVSSVSTHATQAGTIAGYGLGAMTVGGAGGNGFVGTYSPSLVPSHHFPAPAVVIICIDCDMHYEVEGQ